MVLRCCGTRSVCALSAPRLKVSSLVLINDPSLLSTGWDQTGSNGANLSFPQALGIAGSARGEWIVGLINSIIYLTA